MTDAMHKIDGYGGGRESIVRIALTAMFVQLGC